jgi:hypothetical protein
MIGINMIGLNIFVVLYLMTLCGYFFSQTSGKIKIRAPHKITMAVAYFTLAIVLMYKNPRFSEGGVLPSTTVHMLLFVGFFFAVLGDVFLLWNINRGGDFFLAGNIVFGAYYIAQFSINDISFWKWCWVIPVTLLLVGVWVFLMSKWPNIFRLGKMKWPMLFYLTSIIFHGIIAIAALIFLGPMYYWAVLLGIGSILFMISDQLLILDYFVITGTKYMVRISSAFYWVGMLIMVLSTAF